MVDFGGQVVPSLIKSIILVRTSYCLSWSVLNWPTTRPTNQSGRILSTDLAARARVIHYYCIIVVLKVCEFFLRAPFLRFLCIASLENLLPMVPLSMSVFHAVQFFATARIWLIRRKCFGSEESIWIEQSTAKTKRPVFADFALAIYLLVLLYVTIHWNDGFYMIFGQFQEDCRDRFCITYVWQEFCYPTFLTCKYPYLVLLLVHAVYDVIRDSILQKQYQCCNQKRFVTAVGSWNDGMKSLRSDIWWSDVMVGDMIHP